MLVLGLLCGATSLSAEESSARKDRGTFTAHADAGISDAQPPVVERDGGAPSGDPASDGGAAPDTRGASDLAAAADLGPSAPRGLFPESVRSDQSTGIKGRVVDSKTGAGVPGAAVIAHSADHHDSVAADATGAYLAPVPPGTYVVRAHGPLYHGARIDRIRVVRGKLTDLTLVLDPVDEVEDLVVEEMEIPYRADTTTAAAQDQLRQASSGIGEGFGAKQMSQVGASDASSAAARVVGVSIDSSQLVIRGLAGRYNRVLLNGVPVPSVDPDIPGVDLDLFPAGVIDRLNVAKTFLPDMPADFAGGVMEIKSVSFPRKFTLELGVSTGLSSQSTFRDRLDYRGGSRDSLGFDDGGRAIPSATLRRDRPGFLSEQEAESFNNSWQYTRKQSLPKVDVDVTVGDSLKLGRQRRLGYLFTAGYEKDSVRRVGLNRPNPGIGSGGELVERNRYQTESGRDDVQLSALGTASLDLGLDHSLTVLSLFNRSVSDETSLQLGRNADVGGIEKWQLEFLARTLWFNQLLGDHRNLLGTRLRLRWAGFHAFGERDEPDRRTVAYGDVGGTYEWLDTTASGTRFFSNLRQDDLGGSASLRFPLWSEAWATLGGSTHLSTREFVNRRFRMRKHRSNTEEAAFRRPVEELFGPDGIGRWSEMQDATRDIDSYESTQKLHAGFLLVETPLVGTLSLAGGVRSEVSAQDVASKSPFAMAPRADTPRTDRSEVDFLPGAALKYQVSEGMILRGAYGMTVARPQIRELAPYDYYDFLRDRGVVGNPLLKRTLVHNADLRWEWFFSEGQIVAVSAFYKKFLDPIELAILDNVTGSSQFRNGTSAQNLGAEFEFRLGLARLARQLRSFSLDGNLALVRSRIELPAELTAVRSSRPLAGQSPYVANMSLRFVEEATGLTAALVYNVVGPRIADVATLLGDVIPPDIEEQEFHSLDLVGSVKVSESVRLKLRVRNLLLQRRELRQGAFLIQRTDPGISASLGASVAY
jgi:hypothetical protein